MPKRVNTIPQVDFQGGLNLNSGMLQLKENESPRLLNVDLSPLGGFRRRTAVEETASLPVARNRLKFVEGPSGYSADYLLAYRPGFTGFYKSTDGVAWDFVATAASVYGVAVFFPAVYLSAAWSNSMRWDYGGTTTVLGNTFVDDFEAPVLGNMVRSELLCKHRNFMFAAKTTTDTVRGNRVHFSHPGQPEAWRTDDWFDVGDSGFITAMISFDDNLLIFKKDSVWLLQGYDADSFSLSLLSSEAGAMNDKCVSKSADTVYFYSWPYGIFSYNSSGLRYVSYKLENYIRNKVVEPRTYNDNLFWMGGRLYFTLGEWTSNNVLWEGIGPSFTFVLDPALPGDAWTLYSFPTSDASYGTSGLACGTGFSSLGGAGNDAVGFAITEEDYTRVIRFSRATDDDLGDWMDDGYKPIEAYYMTGWQDLDNAAIAKTWGRPVVVMKNLQGAELQFEVYKDYDSANAVRDFSLISDASDIAAMEWDTDLWDVQGWAAMVNDKLGIKKGGRIGRATAVAMLVKCSDQLKTWSVDSIVWKYIPKRVRS